jgi:hypothetical protein
MTPIDAVTLILPEGKEKGLMLRSEIGGKGNRTKEKESRSPRSARGHVCEGGGPPVQGVGGEVAGRL